MKEPSLPEGKHIQGQTSSPAPPRGRSGQGTRCGNLCSLIAAFLGVSSDARKISSRGASSHGEKLTRETAKG